MTLLIIYIAGYIVAYFGQKYLVHDSQGWTRKDRALALTLAALSWVGIIITGAAYFASKDVSDTPAKW